MLKFKLSVDLYYFPHYLRMHLNTNQISKLFWGIFQDPVPTIKMCANTHLVPLLHHHSTHSQIPFPCIYFFFLFLITFCTRIRIHEGKCRARSTTYAMNDAQVNLFDHIHDLIKDTTVFESNSVVTQLVTSL